MILPLAILLLTLYYTAAYGVLRYAVIHTLRRRVDSLIYREAVLIAFAILTPVVITNALIDAVRRRLK